MGAPREPATRFHFSYHKCLTVYFKRVMNRVFAYPTVAGMRTRYTHLNSRIDQFDDARQSNRLVSLNNHFVELDTLGDVRATRFIRDPRDLIVSGYHYHRRAAEEWTEITDPSPEDWRIVNGTIPSGLGRGQSYAQYLQTSSVEDGMLAELEFRREHFRSMARWRCDDPRVLTLTYDEVLDDEVAAFERILDHLRIDGWRGQLGRVLARRYAASTGGQPKAHVRDPRSGQWRSGLPESVLREFERRHGDLIDRYGFDR